MVGVDTRARYDQAQRPPVCHSGGTPKPCGSKGFEPYDTRGSTNRCSLSRADSATAGRPVSALRRSLAVGLSLPVLPRPARGVLGRRAHADRRGRAAPPPPSATRPLTPTFYQWIVDLHPSFPQVNDAFKQTAPLNYQIAPVAGLRHRALRRRGQGQEQHLGRLCRHDAVRRDVGADQGRRHRAVGQLHPQGRPRRHHPVDPRRVHGRRQAVQLAVPARHHQHGLEHGPERRRPASPPMPDDLGRAIWPTAKTDRRFEGRARTASPSMRTAGARWRRSPTA